MTEMADRMEQLAKRVVSKARVFTGCVGSAERWAEIDSSHPDAVAVWKETGKVDAEFARLLNDFVKLARDCEAYIQANDPYSAPVDFADEQRIAEAVGEITAVAKEYTKQRERYAALPNWIEDTNTEFLIGSHRFFRQSAWVNERPKIGAKFGKF